MLISVCKTRCYVQTFLTRPPVNIAVDKIDLQRVRYHYSRDRVTIVSLLWRHHSRLWRHQQDEDRASETQGRCVKIVILSSFMDSFCRVRNKIMHVLSWRTAPVLIRVSILYLFPSLLRHLGEKHKNNPLTSAETVRHSSIYIVLYVSRSQQCSQ